MSNILEGKESDKGKNLVFRHWRSQFKTSCSHKVVLLLHQKDALVTVMFNDNFDSEYMTDILELQLPESLIVETVGLLFKWIFRKTAENGLKLVTRVNYMMNLIHSERSFEWVHISSRLELIHFGTRSLLFEIFISI